jgi:type IV pilus assembly protein PilM
MAKENSAWGIDIGQCALKAVKLQQLGDQLEAVAFDIVEHPQILSDPEANRDELIRSALETFLSRNVVTGSDICVSVPGQSSFTRFVKLPPVDAKKIPEIVRFEAEQQIPFAIDDVIWRWQTFHEKDNPDVEVGIFAMKREDIGKVLAHFSGVAMQVDVVQMAPLALYNFMSYDGQASEQGATLLADIGADKTDLVVSDGARIWTRTIQIGGNNFTEALVKSFKLSFAKAEKLKRTAASSKYARQIFQAMRPVFADLVQEMQRSVGYYTSLHREARFRRVVGLGNGFRLPGLQKFLEQNLSIPVVRVESFRRLRPGPAVSTPVFNDNVLSLGVSYGLAAQGLQEARVATNLLPAQIARSREWQRKKPWFGAIAAVILMTLGIILYRTKADQAALAVEPSGDLKQAETIGKQMADLKERYRKLAGGGGPEAAKAQKLEDMFKYRDYWPSLLDLVSTGIAQQATDQPLIDNYAAASTDEEVQAALARIKATPRDERKMFFIESTKSTYRSDVSEPAGTSGANKPAEGAETGKRGFEITIEGRTTLSTDAANSFLAAVRRNWADLAARYPEISVVRHSQTLSDSSGAAATAANRASYGTDMGAGALAVKAVEPDPMFPDDPSEDMAADTRFTLTLVVSIDDAPVKP